MMNNKVKPNIKLSEPVETDPWLEEPTRQQHLIHPAWQFPLDPTHEIEAAPAINGILTPASNPNLLQIAAPKHHSAMTAVEMLLQDELKLNAKQAQQIWQQVQDALILLWWSVKGDQSLV